MKKSKFLFIGVSLITAMSLLAGCGSSEQPTAQQPSSQQQAGSHEAHSMSMPKEDPMPMMKDMDKALQDIVKNVKAGKTMDAQQNAAQLVSTTNRVLLHMMDAGLKDNLRKAAADLSDSVNSGKLDPATLENKAKIMQDMMKQTTIHLQSMRHTH